VSPAPPGPRRSLTIGNLEALVADMRTGDADAASESGVRKQANPSRASGTHRVIDDKASESTSRGRRPQRAKGAAAQPRKRAGPRPRPTRTNATLSTTAVDPALSGTFGQQVMTQQSKRANPLIWFGILVVLSSLGYFAYTIMTSK
jgi:hypothetical protein